MPFVDEVASRDGVSLQPVASQYHPGARVMD